MAENIERELSWDDYIEKESSFVLLKEGDYNFSVSGFERARHPGSEKLPPCPKAVIQIYIESPEGSTTINHNLFLHTKCEGMLSAFFESIGLKKKGERLQMPWNKVIGTTGRCKVTVRHYKNKDGEDRESNQINRFYPKEDKPAFQAGKF